LFQKGRRRPSGRDIKIRAGTNVFHRVHKAPGGLIRADFEAIEGRFGKVNLSGDFFCFPGEAIGWLESGLKGHAIGEVRTFLEKFYADGEVETPGIEIDDWLSVLEA
ncbi:unnamed protein product, partial [marine sediment metagenome]